MTHVAADVATTGIVVVVVSAIVVVVGVVGAVVASVVASAGGCWINEEFSSSEARDVLSNPDCDLNVDLGIIKSWKFSLKGCSCECT